MTMQTDVLVSQPLGSTNTFKDQAGSAIGRCRIKAIYGTSGASAGTVVVYDGSANTDPCLMTISTPAASNQGTYWLLMPGEGVLARTGLYAVLTNVDSAMVIYG
jgi:hypothetical protein